MVKTNFSNQEIGTVVYILTTKFKLSVNINKAGNINVTDPNNNTEKFVLYKRPEGYLWRRHNLVNEYCYPLNMIGRKSKPGYNYDYRPFNINMAYFNTITDAIAYFIKYYEKHSKTYTNSCIPWPWSKRYRKLINDTYTAIGTIKHDLDIK